MWRIYDVLRKYKLDDSSKLDSNLTAMSDEQLIDFVRDIADTAELDTVDLDTAPKGLNVCPIGGDLCLGNLQEISKQLLLYADHIILEEPITSIAKRAIEKSENQSNKIADLRQELLQQLHPPILQLLLIKSAVEQGIVILSHTRKQVWERAMELGQNVVHPQLDRIVHRLIDKAICWRQPNGVLSFMFGTGSNQFVGIGGALMTGFQLWSDASLPKTERETRPLSYQHWQPPAGSDRVSDRMMESNHDSLKVFRDAVNQLVTRVSLGINLAEASHSTYITDDYIEWEIIKMLSRVEGEQRRIDTSEHVADAVSIQIAKELAFLDSVDINDILELRNKYGDEFANFRGKIISLSETVQEIDDLDKLRPIAKKLVAREISPAISDIKILFDNLGRQRWRDVALTMGFSSLWLLVSHYFPQLQPLIGTVPIAWVAKREIDRRDQIDKLRQNPMYFLWQVSKRQR